MKTVVLPAVVLLQGALAAGVVGQQPGAQPPVPEAAELIARYTKLDPERRSNVVRNIERRLQRENDDTLQRIQSAQQGKAAYPVASQPVWFDEGIFAMGAAARSLVGPDSETHRRMTRGMRPFEFLPDLIAAVHYDWRQGVAVRRPTDLTDDECFANYAHGYTHGTDHKVAQVLAALDKDPLQRRLGTYFEHLYADRNGAVFAGVSLFDAWRAGTTLEMPDTDAIAFAQLVLGTQSFVAPLPENRRRDRLYDKMSEGFSAHRDYRTLRLAIAASFVAAEPKLDPTYQPLVARCHWLWQKHELDLGKVRDYVLGTADRAEFMKRVDEAIKTENDLVTARRKVLADIATFLRSLANHELRAAGG
ncbi:MAG TPA: hypothetical protein VFT55_10585 [Planctomycetota bacterium]|nr:hypothetical protein [Planctomycetota bacterium]